MLRVCFAFESIMYRDVCNATFTVPDTRPSVTQSVTSQAHCPGSQTYCGYDVDVWTRVMDDLGYTEGKDWERICVGTSAFTDILEDMSEFEDIHVARNGSDSTTKASDRVATRRAVCDVLASGTAVTSERSNVLGLQFTRPILQSPMTAVVFAPVQRRGMWEFFRPLTWQLWVTMLATVLFFPLGVVGMEVLFSDRSKYRYERWRWRGRFAVVHAMGEGLWESIGHFLHTSNFPAQSTPARLLVAGYAFMTLVFGNMYLANLSAWMTADRQSDQVNSMHDLWGRSVGTFAAFQNPVAVRYGIQTDAMNVGASFWADDVVRSMTITRGLFAFVFYEPALRSLVDAEKSCSLRLIDEKFRLVDTAFIFRRRFGDRRFMAHVDQSIVSLLENGTLGDIRDAYLPVYTRRECRAVSTGFSEAIPVPLFPLGGLWVIYAAAVLVSSALAAQRVVSAFRHPHDAASRKVLQNSTRLWRSLIARRCESVRDRTHLSVRTQLVECSLLLDDIRRALRRAQEDLE